MAYFKFTAEKMNEVAYLAPPYPIIRYKWSEISKLSMIAQCLIAVATVIFITVFATSVYVSLFVFVQEPKQSLFYPGLGGVIPGIISAFIVVKLLQAIIFWIQSVALRKS